MITCVSCLCLVTLLFLFMPLDFNFVVVVLIHMTQPFNHPRFQLMPRSGATFRTVETFLSIQNKIVQIVQVSHAEMRYDIVVGA